MVLVGGATRLTESGLSITQWKPVTGVIPPLSEADWREEFPRYQQIPQFARLNSDMTIEGFKTIFWWEWSHRLLARILGAAFIRRRCGSGRAAGSGARSGGGWRLRLGCSRWSRSSAGGWFRRAFPSGPRSRRSGWRSIS